MAAAALIVGVLAFSRDAWASQSLGGQVEGTGADNQPMSAGYTATDNNQDGVPESIAVTNGQVESPYLSGNFVAALNLNAGEIETRVRVAGRMMTVVIYCGTAGADTLDARTYTHPVIFFGGQGNDKFRGGMDGDSAFMGDGNDEMEGNGGDDEAWGGDGSDKLGTETMWGSDDAGNDSYTGGTGNDTLGGGTGNDNLSDGGETQADTDVLKGGADADTINADDADANDTIDCGSGDAAADTVVCDQESVNNANSGGVNDSVTKN